MSTSERGVAGQTVLVTGAAQRLGRSIALELARAGAHVAIHYNTSESEAEQLAEDVRKCGVQAWTIAGDLAAASEGERLFARGLEIAGPIDVLINNASIFLKERLGDVTPESLGLHLEVNALAPFFLSRAFAAQDRAGCIVNLLDTRIRSYDKRHVSYHLSKRLLHTITRMMALEFAPNVRVNAVAPGLILPPRGEDVSYLEALASSNPLGAYGEARDVAETVLFLLNSPFVTGQIIYVDGGRHMLGDAYG